MFDASEAVKWINFPNGLFLDPELQHRAGPSARHRPGHPLTTALAGGGGLKETHPFDD